MTNTMTNDSDPSSIEKDGSEGATGVVGSSATKGGRTRKEELKGGGGTDARDSFAEDEVTKSSPAFRRMVSAETHVESDRSKDQQQIRLRDWARIVRLSTRFSEISTEQLERVKLMHDRFSDGAEFSFNYNTLLFVASILAGLGLVSNSSATIIASMLVSPIMGPVVSFSLR